MAVTKLRLFDQIAELFRCATTGKSCTDEQRVQAQDFKRRGDEFLARGDSGRAAECYRKSADACPLDAEVQYRLAALLRANGQAAEAIESFRNALELNPLFEAAYYDLANVYFEHGDIDAARETMQEAITRIPGIAPFHYFLGYVCKAQNDLDAAAASYRQALATKPDYPDVLSNLGIVLREQGNLDEAVACYLQALALQPNNADLHYNLANALKDQNKLVDAVDSYRRALALKPQFVAAHYNLGNALQPQGKLHEAIASYRRALDLKPDHYDAHCNLVFTLDMSPEESTASQQAERRKWDAAHAAHLIDGRLYANDPDPERRLRIGYVSADIRQHSAVFAFGPMLARFDPDWFDVFAYSNSAIEDDITRKLQLSVTYWRAIVGESDEAVAELIRADGIDILVDLSGHSAGNRLRVFARKPAPIQVTAWGYAASTGMRAMDVFFADRVVVPPEEKELFVEEVRYLPCVVGYFRPQGFPDVNELPALKAEGITFGSFNRLAKVTEATYDVWAQVLREIAGSLMVIKAGELEDGATRERVLGHFRAAGIGDERIELLGKSSWEEHMAAYNRIDIALDPFPHGGGVTALEGLLMGVPMVTLRCPTIAGRLSASILTTLGLEDWVAETAGEYVALAQRKTWDLAGLAQLRNELRGRFMASVLGNSQAYVKAAEAEYRLLWREWCARQGANADVA